MNTKIEFHIHTRFSSDSIDTKFFIKLMCKLKKINCIAITDHNEVKGALKYKQYFEKKGIKVIVGEEIFTKDGEIIGLFLDKKIQPNMSLENTIKEIRKQNGIVYVPHPYDEKRKKTVLNYEKLKKCKNDIDLIEIHNGRNISLEYSKIQSKIAKELNINPVIGSDAHCFIELGRNYVILNSKVSEINRDNLIENLKDVTYNKKKCINIIHFYTKLVKIWKMLLRGDFNGIYQSFKKRCQKKL